MLFQYLQGLQRFSYPHKLTKSQKSRCIENISLIHANFLDIDIVGKYSSIILFPPLGVRTEEGRSELLYVEKSLLLLAENGRAVILLPQNILTAPAYHEMREKILNNSSFYFG